MRATTTPHAAALAPGCRVRVPHRSAAYTLTNQLGTIIGPVLGRAGHYVIRLDEPAIYTRWDGRLASRLLVIEPGDALEALLWEPRMAPRTGLDLASP